MVLPIASLGALAGVPVGCSSSTTHPDMAANCTPNIDCGIQPIPTSTVPDSGTSDGAVEADAQTDAPLEIAVTGEVRSASSWGQVVTKGALVSTGYTVTGSRADGSTSTATVTSGAFSLAALQTTANGNWLRVLQGTTLRTLAWVDTSAGDLTGVELPVFDESLPLVTASAVSLPVVATGRASLAIRIVDATGAPVKGVTAKTANYLNQSLGFFGPYYDDGGDGVTQLASATSTKGTIVYLGVDAVAYAAGLSVSLTIPVVGNESVTLPAKADAVTFRVVVAK